MNKDNTKTRTKTYNILAVFYFFLIFGIVIYLFMTLFSKSNGSAIDTEMEIFNNSDSVSQKGGHNLIMNIPDFLIKKRK